MGLSSSRFFAWAVAKSLQRQRPEQMVLQLNDVYATDRQTAEKHLLKAMKAKTRQEIKK
jgi:hypothetical protein